MSNFLIFEIIAIILYNKLYRKSHFPYPNSLIATYYKYSIHFILGKAVEYIGVLVL